MIITTKCCHEFKSFLKEQNFSKLILENIKNGSKEPIKLTFIYAHKTESLELHPEILTDEEMLLEMNPAIEVPVVGYKIMFGKLYLGNFQITNKDIEIEIGEDNNKFIVNFITGELEEKLFHSWIRTHLYTPCQELRTLYEVRNHIVTILDKFGLGMSLNNDGVISNMTFFEKETNTILLTENQTSFLGSSFDEFSFISIIKVIASRVIKYKFFSLKGDMNVSINTEEG